MGPHPTIPLYEHVARLAQSWNTGNNIGLVVGATQPESLARLRAVAPDLWFLVPGVGTQGGDLETALRLGLRKDGKGSADKYLPRYLSFGQSGPGCRRIPRSMY